MCSSILFHHGHSPVVCFVCWGSVSFPPQRRDDSDEAGNGNLTRTAVALEGPLRSAGCPVIFGPGLAEYTHAHSGQQGCPIHSYTSKRVRRQVNNKFLQHLPTPVCVAIDINTLQGRKKDLKIQDELFIHLILFFVCLLIHLTPL